MTKERTIHISGTDVLVKDAVRQGISTMNQTISIAYLEDDLNQGKAVVRWLSKRSIEVHVYNSLDTFLAAMELRSYDAFILDVELDGELAGMTALEHIRLVQRTYTPVLMVSSNDHWEDALNKGADDFLGKPLNSTTLMVHLNRLLRPIEQQSDIEHYEPFLLNSAQQQITLNGLDIGLSDDEYNLASALLRNYGKVLSFGKLMDTLTAEDECDSTKALGNRIVELKRKMNLRNIDNWHLEAVYQHGYRLVSTQYDLPAKAAVSANT